MGNDFTQFMPILSNLAPRPSAPVMTRAFEQTQVGVVCSLLRDVRIAGSTALFEISAQPLPSRLCLQARVRLCAGARQKQHSLRGALLMQACSDVTQGVSATSQGKLKQLLCKFILRKAHRAPEDSAFLMTCGTKETTESPLSRHRPACALAVQYRFWQAKHLSYLAIFYESLGKRRPVN